MTSQTPRTTTTGSPTDWLQAYVPLGVADDDSWEATGGGVLLLDRPIIWLVTARSTVERAGSRDLVAWIEREAGAGLLNLTDAQRQSGLGWVHHPAGLSAAMLPVDPSFRIKAFAETQCTRVRDLQPLHPAATLGCLYGPAIPQQGKPTVAAHDGVISAANAQTGAIFSTAPMLPRNPGAPLLLASPYGGAVTLAGILLDNAMLTDTDPRALPVRLGRAICVDAALELVRGPDATVQRRRITEASAEAGAEEPRK